MRTAEQRSPESLELASAPPAWQRLLLAAGPDMLICVLFAAILLTLAAVYGAQLHLKEGAILLPSGMALGLIAVAYVVGERRTFPLRARQVLRDWLPFIAAN